MTDYCQVVTTTDSYEAAEELARGVVEARLGACVQIIGPIRGVYRWQGELQVDQEWQCVVKTTTARLPDLTEYVRTHHDYEVPEVLVTPVITGNPDYLAWLADETS
ncbi:divalent cation tolerance protein [Streptoalloteichus tenebrarius]|uniref:Divalent cation tolerance protein n=1 Tax=Streptoalloteichus tenebrarius (strain ATCC 17920 / DSM 40477 / JCM 4838 / CBS 697.72 / NBRC 16177 / NCIMB 11028 / NRRL B-12390 / A12253. 1 / ISP 5477) TaxID=1933 RepID=A0ABT1HTA2_STRSD|nr:divalent-cation tolerance protein CutA [Streptoalloteichus tenebrarius]MCP2258751.1 divalent cation tolerance protein [Streptoalloteichus tenebrarius]BFF02904.1 divalent-cation tolerance protein CutA [Streptoalloteichus tenebrarius]